MSFDEKTGHILENRLIFLQILVSNLQKKSYFKKILMYRKYNTLKCNQLTNEFQNKTLKDSIVKILNEDLIHDKSIKKPKILNRNINIVGCSFSQPVLPKKDNKNSKRNKSQNSNIIVIKEVFQKKISFVRKTLVNPQNIPFESMNESFKVFSQSNFQKEIIENKKKISDVMFSHKKQLKIALENLIFQKKNEKVKKKVN